MDEYGKSILAMDTIWRRYDMVGWGCCVGALATSAHLIFRWTDILDDIRRYCMRVTYRNSIARHSITIHDKPTQHELQSVRHLGGDIAEIQPCGTQNEIGQQALQMKTKLNFFLDK